MKIAFWLTVNKRGSVRTTKTQPSLSWDEVAIKQTLELPNALFEKPRITATVTIPESAAVSEPIDAQVVEDAKLAIEQALGMEIKLTVEPKKTE